jgi:hypothetical protein
MVFSFTGLKRVKPDEEPNHNTPLRSSIIELKKPEESRKLTNS